MNTKMHVTITIVPTINTVNLIKKLEEYGAEVTDVGKNIRVDTEIDIRENTIEFIMQACKAYGDCDVTARMV